jgi:hypothetical protein
MESNVIKKKLDRVGQHLTVKELKDFIADLPDHMKVFIVSDDEMPVRKLIGISSEERAGCYCELYLDTADTQIV